jgi:hypothetical protein
MMKTYSHIRRQALNQAADALEPTAPDTASPPSLMAAAASTPTVVASATAVAKPDAPSIAVAVKTRTAQTRRVMSHRTSQNADRRSRIRKFSRENGSSGWTRTSNPPVNSLMQVVYPVGSSMVYLTLDRRFSLVFGRKLFTDCSLS